MRRSTFLALAFVLSACEVPAFLGGDGSRDGRDNLGNEGEGAAAEGEGAGDPGAPAPALSFSDNVVDSVQHTLNFTTAVKPKIAVDGDGVFHVAYYSITDGQLRYARGGGDAFAVELVAELGAETLTSAHDVAVGPSGAVVSYMTAEGEGAAARAESWTPHLVLPIQQDASLGSLFATTCIRVGGDGFARTAAQYTQFV